MSDCSKRAPLHIERKAIARFYDDAWQRAVTQARREVHEALDRISRKYPPAFPLYTPDLSGDCFWCATPLNLDGPRVCPHCAADLRHERPASLGIQHNTKEA